MNKTVRKILQAISYLITLFLGAAGGSTENTGGQNQGGTDTVGGTNTGGGSDNTGGDDDGDDGLDKD